MGVKISSVANGTAAEKHGIKSGDSILTINGNDIIDVLDYRFYQNEKRLKLKIETENGKVRTVRIHKGEYEELGLEFETYLMDKQKRCKNNCIFCFIDQLPAGMRESLYFKDDDSRLSFLFGNYITLTNLTEHETERIINMHISPVNISVHTTNPELRSKMMGNRFAGESLSLIKRFDEAGIKMNCQLVLCPGINDGEELERSFSDLLSYENVECIAAVPVGLTDHREGLPELTPYSKEQAAEVIAAAEKYGEISIERYGERRVFVSDEFYLKTGKPIPDAEFYGEFLQLENGVGLCALFEDEFTSALSCVSGCTGKHISAVTGAAAYSLIKKCAEKAEEKIPGLKADIYKVENDFFGKNVTVSGLVTGTDIIKQLKGKITSDVLLVPDVMLRYEGDLFLDGVSVEELGKELNVKTEVIRSGGADFLEALKGSG